MMKQLQLFILAGLFAAFLTAEAPTNKELKQKITTELKAQAASVAKFREQIQDQKIIILLGNTKSGKSTLVNYLIGTKLKSYDPMGMSDYKITKNQANHGPEIGEESLSCTSVPQVYPMLGSSDLIVDSPGLEDNRGFMQNIINSLYINQIKYAKSVKFVIVFDLNELIADNINSFLDTLDYVEELLYKFGDIQEHVCAVFTKVSPNYDSSHITKLLTKKIVNIKLDVSKEFVKTIADNPRLIGIFRKPMQEQDVSTNLDVNIRNAIKATTAAKMSEHEIILALSEEAKGALLVVYPEYTDSNYFKEELDRTFAKYQNYLKDQWAYVSYDEELNQTRFELNQIKKVVESQIKTNLVKLEDISTSVQVLQQLPASEQFLQSFNLPTMLDQSSVIDQQNKKAIMENYSQALANLLTNINHLLQKIQAETQERDRLYIKYTSEGAFVDIANSLAFAVTSGVIEPMTDFVSDGVKLSEKVYTKEVTAMIGALGKAGVSLDVKEKLAEYGTLTPKTIQEIALQAKSLLLDVATGPAGIAVGGFAVGGAAGAAYSMYTERYVKRNEVRASQGR